MLAPSFPLLIGASLIAGGFDAGLPTGYIYGPTAFAILVEMLNLRARATAEKHRARASGPAASPVPEPVHLRSKLREDAPTASG